MNNQSALAQAQEIFEAMINAVRDYAIFAIDLHGHVLTWNVGAQRIKGYTAEEIIGSHFSKFYSKADVERRHPQHELQQAIQHGTYEEEGWRYRKDGSRFWASVVITVLKDDHDNVRGFCKVTRDLSERKMAEDNLRRANENLEQRVFTRTQELEESKLQAEKAVQVRDQFLSMASHELKTPLTSLKLQAQLRKRKLQLGKLMTTPAQIESMLTDDEQQINRFGRLVDNMLDVSKLNAGRFSLHLEHCNLSTLVTEVTRRFHLQLENLHIPLETHIETEVWGNWDRYRIEQVCANLLTNAIKYGDGKTISLHLKKHGSWACLSVKDEGFGIAPHDQDRIFHQFERATTDSAASGLGLGLYISRQIMDAHGGNISLKSQVGQGSTFTVELPLSI